jgi:hypothetical protein
VTVTFDPGSRLALVERDVFFECPSLSSICIPSSLQRLFVSYSDILKITVFEDNSAGSDNTDFADFGRESGMDE